jgi:hypothetical protein
MFIWLLVLLVGESIASATAQDWDAADGAAKGLAPSVSADALAAEAAAWPSRNMRQKTPVVALLLGSTLLCQTALAQERVIGLLTLRFSSKHEVKSPDNAVPRRGSDAAHIVNSERS